MKTIDYIKSLDENEIYLQKVRIEFNLFEIRDTILPFFESIKDNFKKKELLEALDNAKVIKYSFKKANAVKKSKRKNTKCSEYFKNGR